MKATSFDPQDDRASALIMPEAVLLTVGNLVNRILDRAVDPVILIIDQVSAQPRLVQVNSVADGTVAGAASFAELMASLEQDAADGNGMAFHPEPADVAPFEG